MFPIHFRFSCRALHFEIANYGKVVIFFPMPYRCFYCFLLYPMVRKFSRLIMQHSWCRLLYPWTSLPDLSVLDHQYKNRRHSKPMLFFAPLRWVLVWRLHRLFVLSQAHAQRARRSERRTDVLTTFKKLGGWKRCSYNQQIIIYSTSYC